MIDNASAKARPFAALFTRAEEARAEITMQREELYELMYSPNGVESGFKRAKEKVIALILESIDVKLKLASATQHLGEIMAASLTQNRDSLVEQASFSSETSLSTTTDVPADADAIVTGRSDKPSSN